ncbi:hypothetical protein [Streptomyces sp. NPDC020667]|uniref:hypothetical protein n=1 Tax=Streptomyces sp. NPDC020667 TaxID=3154895 RepID=UPI0033CB7796
MKGAATGALCNHRSPGPVGPRLPSNHKATRPRTPPGLYPHATGALGHRRLPRPSRPVTSTLSSFGSFGSFGSARWYAR